MIIDTIERAKLIFGDLPIQYEYLYSIGAVLLFVVAIMTVALTMKPFIKMMTGRW